MRMVGEGCSRSCRHRDHETASSGCTSPNMVVVSSLSLSGDVWQILQHSSVAGFLLQAQEWVLGELNAREAFESTLLRYHSLSD